MAITEVKRNITIGTSKVEFICPVCKAKKALDVPNSVIAEAKQLTTMSIARGLICEHQFQAFVDKQFQVRGYQRVDFEFESRSDKLTNTIQNKNNDEDNQLFENLILEGNYLECKPIIKKDLNSKMQKHQKQILRKRKLSLEEIYNEFWEFIDDDNLNFRYFIDKDFRRDQRSFNV